MDLKEHLEKLHQESVEKVDGYLKTKEMHNEHQQKADEAKKKWQSAWVELMNTLMVLETLEI